MKVKEKDTNLRPEMVDTNQTAYNMEETKEVGTGADEIPTADVDRKDMASEDSTDQKEEKAHKKRPALSELESELKRERYKTRYRSVLRSTVFTLVTVAAVAILVATLWMPVLQIYGTSMSPTLEDRDIVVSRKTSNLKQGDVVAFYYNNRILVKRFIAGPGDWVDIDQEGNVYVNGEALNEPYVVEKSIGETNIDLPYQVPENKIFVMGDHRTVSVDSRNASVGCVSDDQIVGELVFKVWPLKGFGLVK